MLVNPQLLLLPELSVASDAVDHNILIGHHTHLQTQQAPQYILHTNS